jgi:hypothetical protein
MTEKKGDLLARNSPIKITDAFDHSSINIAMVAGLIHFKTLEYT